MSKEESKTCQETLLDRLAPEQPEGCYSIMRQMDLNEIKVALADPETVQAVQAILIEFERAKRKWPNWPGDIVHAAGILAGEAGECLKAANHHREGRGTDGRDSMFMAECEAIQAGAMALRFLVNLPRKAAQ